MKKALRLFSCAAAFTFGMAAVPAAQADVINVAHVFAIEHPVHQSLLEADKWLKEKSGGKYEFKIYPATTYASQKNSIKAVVMGTLDVFIVVNPIDYYKPSGALLAPYAFRDYDHWKKFKQSDTYKKMLDEISKSMGTHQMEMFTFGFRHATTKAKPAKTPEEFQGLKLRVVNFPPYPEAASVLNAVGVPLPLSELYMALATGVVDGQENPFSQTFHQKFYEQQKYLILTGHMLATDGWMMSKKRWNSLPEADRPMIEEAFRISANFVDEATIKDEQALQAKLVELGMEVVEVDKQPFMARAQEIIKKYPDWAELYGEISNIK